MIGIVESSKALTRSGARPGDGVYVSGTIGDAGFCFWKLSNDLVPSNQELKRLNCPTPRVELGLALKNLASACIDISDGLEQDLSHILKASSVGAVIEVEKIPISEALHVHVKDTNDWSIPLCGGDDYELCFTVPEGNEEALKKSQSLAMSTLPELVLLANLWDYRSRALMDLESHTNTSKT